MRFLGFSYNVPRDERPLANLAMVLLLSRAGLTGTSVCYEARGLGSHAGRTGRKP
jgi:hypothetical protein